jgi:hypothetical protein
MYGWFKGELWEKCFSLIDPKLREQAKVELSGYADSLKAFKESYGSIRPWHVRISPHLDASSNKHDRRPFAYVYVIWQDQAHGFHLFRERWVKQDGRWFTRVVGLVPNRQEAAPGRD